MYKLKCIFCEFQGDLDALRLHSAECIAHPLQTRLALYAILDAPGVEFSRGRYWDVDQRAYRDGWIIGDGDRMVIIGAGPTLEAALRDVRQKAPSGVGDNL